jgi:hypothetical protein
MTSLKYERLSLEDFEALRTRLKGFSAKSVEAARLVLVEGMNGPQAGLAVGMSKQGVEQALGRIAKARVDVPKDWVQVDTFAPRELAEAFLRSIEAEKAKLADQ